MKLLLIPEQKQALQTQHDHPPDGMACAHIKAVPLTSKGWATAMIAQALRIDEATVPIHLVDDIFSEKLPPDSSC